MAPLVFLTLRGGRCHAAAVFYRRHVFLVSLQKELSYSSVVSWLCSAILCLRGARAVHFH